jgi:phage gp36-like protein
MPYCTQQNLVDRFGQPELIQLTNKADAAATTINATVLNAAIADADAEIDGYLVAYVPLAIIPANLVRIACDIARYYLYDDLVTDQVRARYKDGVAYLMKVAEGKISIGPDVGGDIDLTADAGVAHQVGVRQFGDLSSF